MTTALIADDEPHLATYLQGLLAKAWPELQVVAVAKNGIEAAERIAALQPDVAFLDIKMPGLTGLDVAQGIEGMTRVVFVTAFDEFAVAAFEQQALDYVLKPSRPSASPAPWSGSRRLRRRRPRTRGWRRRCSGCSRHRRPRRRGLCATSARARVTWCIRSTSPRCCTSMPTTSTPACAPQRASI
jgi:CheY-like chemotaxis protein